MSAKRTLTPAEQSLKRRIEALYGHYKRTHSEDDVLWFMDAIADLTPAEIDSAFREGPKVWQYGMPNPQQFREAVSVKRQKDEGCGKCVNGFVPDPGGGPHAVRRCECQKK